MEELDYLSAGFLSKRCFFKNSDVVLLILAVNCAYHYYDDEGFWKHFCRLLNCEKTTDMQGILGAAIERCLVSLGLLKIERTGPFRYVGAILEQCGLSHKYIVTFARIIRDMKNRMGIDCILDISQDEFKGVIRDTVSCSPYLRRFLEDIAGWQFTLQVVRLIQLYGEGALNIDDLSDLPGYQPDFWEELVDSLEIEQKKTLRRTGFHFKPRFIFLANKNCLGLQFPSPRLIKGITQPHGNIKWKYPVTMLEGNEMWSEQYSGHFYGQDGTPGQWAIKGWIPDGLPALFDSISGIIDRKTVIQPGLYYLLAPLEYQPTCSIIKDLGQVRVQGKWKYEAFTVQLNAGEVLSGYQVSKAVSGKEIEMNWIKPEKKHFRYGIGNYMDIFEGSLPDINISDFSLIENNYTGMFYNIGNGTRRIRTRNDLIGFQEEVRRQVPVQGSVWLSNITRGRFTTGRAIKELHFVILPECIIGYQEHIYSYNEEATISINEKSCLLHLDGCKKMDQTGQLWAIPVAVNKASGFIEFGEVTVGIEVPVYRAGIFELDKKRVRYKCLSEFGKGTDLMLTGYPDSEGLLCLPDIDAGITTVSVKFDNRGLAIINAQELVEMIETSGYQVCEMALENTGQTASTGTILIELPVLKQKTYHGEVCNISLKTEKNIPYILNLCARISQNRVSLVELNRLPEHCTQFDEWVLSMLACANVFDHSPIIVGGEELDWAKKLDNKDIKEALHFYKQHTAGLMDNEPCVFNPDVLPDVERWQQNLYNILLPYSFEGRIKMIEDWAADVKGRGGPLHSIISKQQGGSSLSRAWRQYLQKRYDIAIDLINNIKSGSVLVHDLKIFLHSLVLLRVARIRAAKEMILNASYFTELGTLNTRLKHIISVVDGSPEGLQENEGDILISVVPLDTSDRKLLERATSSYKYVNDDLLSNGLNDWLIMFYLINLLEAGEKRSLIAADLLNIENSIPSSPEKGDIIRQLIIVQQGE